MRTFTENSLDTLWDYMSIIIPNIIYNMICDSINSPFTSKTLSCMYCMYILNFNVRCLSKIPGFFSSSTAGARELREKQKNAGDEKRWAHWKAKKGTKTFDVSSVYGIGKWFWNMESGHVGPRHVMRLPTCPTCCAGFSYVSRFMRYLEMKLLPSTSTLSRICISHSPWLNQGTTGFPAKWVLILSSFHADFTLTYRLFWGAFDHEIQDELFIPVVPHKAVAENSKIGNL